MAKRCVSRCRRIWLPQWSCHLLFLSWLLGAVFRIRDILVRIRILGRWLTDPALDPDPARFVSNLLQDANNKYFPKFLCLFLFEGTFIKFFNNKKTQRSHKTVEIKTFLQFFVWRIRNRSPIRPNKIRIRIQEAQKHTDRSVHRLNLRQQNFLRNIVVPDTYLTATESIATPLISKRPTLLLIN